MNYFHTVEANREQTIYRMPNQPRKIYVRVPIKEKQSLYKRMYHWITKTFTNKEEKTQGELENIVDKEKINLR